MPRHTIPSAEEATAAFHQIMKELTLRDGEPPAGYTAPEGYTAPTQPVAPPPAEVAPPPPAYSQGTIDALLSVGLSKQDAAAMALGKPLVATAEQKKHAAVQKQRLMNDPEWVERYMNGGVEEQARMTELNLRICAGLAE